MVGYIPSVPEVGLATILADVETVALPPASVAVTVQVPVFEGAV